MLAYTYTGDTTSYFLAMHLHMLMHAHVSMFACTYLYERI